MDVGDWLRSLGLGEYEALFLENKIDAEVLPDLTDSDLSQFGVPFGHRKRLLKVIASLNATESQAKPANPAPTSPSTDGEDRARADRGQTPIGCIPNVSGFDGLAFVCKGEN